MQKFTLISETVRQRCLSFVAAAPLGSLVTIREGDARTSAQNSKQWPELRDIAKQLTYHGVKLSEEDWKDVFTASLSGELRMVPTLDNQRIVILGLHTSKMSKRTMSELLELIVAYGTQHGVQWSERVAEP